MQTKFPLSNIQIDKQFLKYKNAWYLWAMPTDYQYQGKN